jgi:hypothetical protein
MAKIASAYFAAKSTPLGEVPACRIAGPSCGERTTLSGPRDLKNGPACSMRWTLAASANTAPSRSITTASSSQLDHSLRQTSMNSWARS